ncbi:MAG: TetR/AcrR family transcriptional regulator [Anaerolineae bacterium]|nr:TetR/AcrR family transcriptional regulator [Anaerolineae bacterium]
MQAALLELLQKKRLSDIQIKEITELADVSRPAFYLHFYSKEELLFSYIDDLFDELNKTVFENMAKKQNITLKMLVLTSFKLCKDHAETWQLAMQIENKDMLMLRWRQHIAQLMDTFAKQPGSQITPHEMDSYVKDFVTGGVYMVLQRWIKEGLQTPVEQIGQLAYELVEHYGAWSTKTDTHRV